MLSRFCRIVWFCPILILCSLHVSILIGVRSQRPVVTHSPHRCHLPNRFYLIPFICTFLLRHLVHYHIFAPLSGRYYYPFAQSSDSYPCPICLIAESFSSLYSVPVYFYCCLILFSTSSNNTNPFDSKCNCYFHFSILIVELSPCSFLMSEVEAELKNLITDSSVQLSCVRDRSVWTCEYNFYSHGWEHGPQACVPHLDNHIVFTWKLRDYCRVMRGTKTCTSNFLCYALFEHWGINGNTAKYCLRSNYAEMMSLESSFS